MNSRNRATCGVCVPAPIAAPGVGETTAASRWIFRNAHLTAVKQCPKSALPAHGEKTFIYYDSDASENIFDATCRASMDKPLVEACVSSVGPASEAGSERPQNRMSKPTNF